MDTYRICTPCEDCLQILEAPLDKLGEASGNFARKLRALKSSAAESCPICARLVYTVNQHLCQPGDEQYSDSDIVVVAWKRPEFIDNIKFVLAVVRKADKGSGRSRNDQNSVTLSLKLFEYEPDGPVSEIPSATSRTWTSESLDVMEWLTTCQTQHKCGSKRNTGYLPPRLIYCADSGTRVVDAEEDAVVATRKFGLDYLWIDSLCIIQKGELHQSDWQRHVKEMSRIYENCVINISASHSKDSHGGLFRSAEFAYPDIIDRAVKISSVGNRSAKMTGIIHASDNCDVGDFAINKRGWVCQERLMSPRTVHYGEFQMYWECEALVASTAFPNGNGGLEINRVPYTFLSGELDDDEASSTAKRWLDIIKDYSHAKLTKQTDRLPAIAAVAQKVNEDYFNATYIAGIFLSHFHLALCFEGKKRLLREPNDTGYIAPTWSWASTYGVVWTNARVETTESIARVSSYSVDLVDETNEYGQIRDARLTLQCARWKWKCDGDEKYPEEVKVPYMLLRRLKTRGYAEATLQWDDETPERWTELSKSTVLLALAWDTRWHEVRGILVCPSTDIGDGSKGRRRNEENYIRVGVWCMELRLLAAGAKETLCKCFGFRDGTFTLV